MRALNTGIYDSTSFMMLSLEEQIEEYNKIINRTNAQFRQMKKMGVPQEAFGLKGDKLRVQRISIGKLKKAMGSSFDDKNKQNAFMMREYQELTTGVGKGYTKSVYKQLEAEKKEYEKSMFGGAKMDWKQFRELKNVMTKKLVVQVEYYELLQYAIEVGFKGKINGKSYENGVDYSRQGRLRITESDFQDALDAINKWYVEKYGQGIQDSDRKDKISDLLRGGIERRLSHPAKYESGRTIQLSDDLSIQVYQGDLSKKKNR